ncbi:methyltransferase [Thiolapillus sp.]
MGLGLGLVRRAGGMTENHFHTPFGDYRLQRLPARRRELLRAWDAADEYLLHHLAEQGLPSVGDRALLLNDSFGALATALHSCPLWSASDSLLAHEATRLNYQANGLAPENLRLLTSLEMPRKTPDLVIIKVPKTLALLEYQLHRLRPLLTPDTRILAAGMMKALPGAAWKKLESLLGPVQTFPGRKKAKLMEIRFDPGLAAPPNPWPTRYQLEGTPYHIINHANVFSREKLDIGTRFFLQHLPTGRGRETLLDLGCGNGVLALMALHHNPEAVVHCVDESFMAVASARATLKDALGPEVNAHFHVAHDLTGFSDQSVDRVLCNPPFHQQQVVGDHIARQMFRDARRVLRHGGELWVVGNRHLGYHKTLKRLFGNATLVASNRKFVILCATRA